MGIQGCKSGRQSPLQQGIRHSLLAALVVLQAGCQEAIPICGQDLLDVGNGLQLVLCSRHHPWLLVLALHLHADHRLQQASGGWSKAAALKRVGCTRKLLEQVPIHRFCGSGYLLDSAGCAWLLDEELSLVPRSMCR